MGERTMTTLDCLLAEELRALRDGRLDADADDRANAHLDECDVCQALYYELPEHPASTPEARAPSEAELSGFAERMNVHAAKVISFTRPSWTGVRLAAHAVATRPLLVSPSDGARVLETDDLELRVVEFQREGQIATDGTLVLVEATLTPTTSQEFTATTDVIVTDANEDPLEPLDVFVRPLVWTGTFAGSGVFVIRVPSRAAIARVEVQRPR